MPKGIYIRIKPNYNTGKTYEELFGIKKAKQLREHNGIKHLRENLSQKTLDKISSSVKKLWQNPDYRKHMKQVHKGKKQSEESNRKRSESLRLNKHPNWQDGRSFEPYPLGWTKTYKEQIRFRDKYTCQICGCSETECRRKLDIHHINYDKKNITPKNLISLCRSCHMKTNYNKQYWKKILKWAIKKK